MFKAKVIKSQFKQEIKKLISGRYMVIPRVSEL